MDRVGAGRGGYRVLVQAWDFVPGSNWVKRMQDGTAGAERTIAVLSDDYLESVYGGAEWQAAWAADPAGADRRLLPTRVGKCATGAAGGRDRILRRVPSRSRSPEQ